MYALLGEIFQWNKGTENLDKMGFFIGKKVVRRSICDGGRKNDSVTLRLETRPSSNLSYFPWLYIIV